jgi:hypothetical protein
LDFLSEIEQLVPARASLSVTPYTGLTGLKGNLPAVGEAKFLHQRKPALPNWIGAIQPNTAQGELQTLVSASNDRN